MQTIKFTQETKSSKNSNGDTTKKQFYYADTEEKRYFGFNLEDIPLNLMKKSYYADADGDVVSSEDIEEHGEDAFKKLGSREWFNHKGITYIDPFSDDYKYNGCNFKEAVDIDDLGNEGIQ